MTYSILAVMFATWILLQGAGFDQQALAASVCNLGMVPGELTHLAPVGTAVPLGRGMACVVDNDPINILTPFISMFLHGGWGHLLGNALFFWVFGNNIEDSLGHFRFVVFYLVCGLAAAIAHIVAQPASPLPTVGASGAMSGILGAYLVLYPRVRVRMLFIFFVVPIRAWLVLVWWFFWQLVAALPELKNGADLSGGVAVWAHVGGFLSGVLLVKLFENRHLVVKRVPYR
jgi:membrane associated rhomboid family serine protease